MADYPMIQRIGFIISIILLSLGSFSVSLAQDAPEEIVIAFLDAWNAADYETMYGYIHSQSQVQFPQPVFETRYSSTQDTIALTGVTYSITKTQLQGESAAVSYDVVLQSSKFGEIEDPGRLMRLMKTPEGWRIAWSTMDIFDTLSNNSILRVYSRPSRRATIYDRNGQVLAADGGVSVSMYGQKIRMSGEDDCLSLLGQVTRQPIVRLERTFDENNPETIFFLGEIPVEVYDRHSGDLLNTCGIGESGSDVFFSLPHRTYYEGNIAPHVVGYVGQVTAEDEAQYGVGQMVGRAGAEYAYQDHLAGQAELVLLIMEPGGTILRELAGTSGTEPTPIQLTIDRELQRITTQALSDAYNYAAPNWGAPGISIGGAAVVLDANSGAILAMSSYPMFNPTWYNPETMTPDIGIVLSEKVFNHPSQPLLNRATQEQYSPGSVFKTITLTAVLNEGLVDENDVYYCDLYWQGAEFGDTVEERSDWKVIDDEPATGDVTPALALAASCNPFFWEYGATLYNEVGPETLIEYAKLMGMGSNYGFEGALQETPGLLPIPIGPDVAIIEAVGQGDIAVSPLQMAVAISSIANDGTVYRPYLLQQIGGMDSTAIIETREPQILNTLDLNPGVLDIVREGMCEVVTNFEYGTGYGRFYNGKDWGSNSNINYTVCGKTGTAETARYPNAWFVAYAPAENPEIVVVVMVDQSREGSQVSAPIVRRILDGYFNEPPERYPPWWNNESYNPLTIPEGGGAG
jgi:penicillin-binding protein 2